ncbi:MAG: YdeI/OmpD-associated family protein [Actinomycetota bacterium]
MTWKKHTGRPAPSYDEAVTQSLAFGWVDSRVAKLDADRGKLWQCPRKITSGWSRPNKERVVRLEAHGEITAAGQRVLDLGKTNGAWSLLEWIVQAKRPTTRAARIQETTELAARGERANQWSGRRS